MKSRSILSALAPRWVKALAVVIAGAVAVPMVVSRNEAPTPIGVYTRHVARAVIAEPAAKPVATQSANWELANLDNTRVESWLKRFTTDMRSTMVAYLDRMDRYDVMISTKLEARDMPQELIFLAMIESGFNPKAKSPVSAQGLWQFMAATGRAYGLTVSRRVDERNDPAKATDAALAYLSDLHERFGSWYLAFAAYNTGEGRVAKVMKRNFGRASGSDADFYRIASQLPKETRDYVPKMIAVARIAKDPGGFGFDVGA